MPTIKEVALACGVSQATVSQVLNNGPRPVHPHTRERVLQTARALDYRPNAIARGLARKRMNTIGLVFPHGPNTAQTNPFFIVVLDGVLSVSTRREQSTMLCTIRTWDMPEYPPELSDGRCDGVMLMVPPAECALPRFLQQRQVPLVLVNGQDPSGQVSCVDVDNVRAASEMTEYLLQLGHRRIAFVYKPQDLIYPFVHERQEGYRQAMIAAGLSEPALLSLTKEQVETLDMTAADRPTALFCSYDAMAISLIGHLQRRGVSVPQEISVVGFDDVPGGASLHPALTTVRQPMTQIGERAAEMLLALIEGTSRPGQQELLPTELVIRQSAVPPRTG